MSCGSWISKVTAWVTEVELLAGIRIFLFVTTFRLTLGPCPTGIEYETRVSSVQPVNLIIILAYCL
jgi:hypothetical protein